MTETSQKSADAAIQSTLAERLRNHAPAVTRPKVAAIMDEAADTIEALESKLRCVISHATGGHLQDIDLPLNTISCEITAMRNKVWEAGVEKGQALAAAAKATT